MSTTASHSGGRSRPGRQPGPAPRGGSSALGRRRHRDDHQAQPHRLHAYPRGPVLLDPAAHHVRAAVPLRLRRGHPPRIHGLTYIDFLMAGIFVQSVGFGGIGTAVGLADDLQKGLIERFRALPMARSAVLAGRTTADLVRNVFVLLLMTGVGALVGFNFPNGALGFIGACAVGAALRLRVAVGVRRHRAHGVEQRDGAGHGVPDPLPPDLRLAGLRADQLRCRAGSRGSPPTSPSAS